MTQQTVLIGFAEALAGIETAWSLQDAGFRVVAFGRGGRSSALRRVRDLEFHEVPAPELDAVATVTGVQALARRVRADVLLPLDDHSLWVSTQLGAEVRVAGARGRAVEVALDKAVQIGAARAAGLPVPSTEIVGSFNQIGPVDRPTMIKPARAVYEVDGRLVRPTGVVCTDDRERELAGARNWYPPILGQPLIHGTGEGLFGFVGSGGVTCWSAHRRVRMINPQGSGSSACVSASVDQELIDPSTRFLEEIGWRGMFMLEFLRDSGGTPWFMELNGRPWGSLALARRRGFEYPAWTVRASLDPAFEPQPPAAPPDLMCRNLGLELVHLMFVMRGPQTDAPVRWPRLGASIADVLWRCRRASLYNWKRSEPDVLVADTVGTVLEYLGKLKLRRG